VFEDRWWELYRAAVLECDPRKLRARVHAAVEAVEARAALYGQVSFAERLALADAGNALRVLRREHDPSESDRPRVEASGSADCARPRSRHAPNERTSTETRAKKDLATPARIRTGTAQR
jgi:hypothetical protein